MQLLLEIGLPISMFIVMFWLGLGLGAEDFGRVARGPKLFALGIFLQIVSLPAIALLIVFLWPEPLSTGLAIGMMILAASPGGLTSNVFTRLAGGDTALSISLTATMTIASIITIPAIVLIFQELAGVADLDRPSVLSLSLGLFAMIALPVGLGMLLRSRLAGVAARSEAIVRRVAILLIASLLVLALVENADALGKSLGEAALLALSLNIAAMGVAMLAANAAGAGPPQVTALTLECGLQSTPMAITLVVLLDLPAEAMSPAAVYGISMLLTASLFSIVRARTSAVATRPVTPAD